MSEHSAICILLIEDNPDDADLIREKLACIPGPRFEVKHAVSLAAGIDHLREKKSDLIFLDLYLPDSYGMGTLEKVLAEAGDAPIVVLTATEDDPAALESTQRGAQDFLVKGQIDSDVLLRCIRYAIEYRRIHKQYRQNKELLRLMTSHKTDGIVVIDHEGVIRFVNPAAEVLFGQESSRLLGRVFAFPIEAGCRDQFEVVCASGRTARVELRSVKRDWLESEVSILTLRDLTESNKSSEEHQQAQKFESISLLAGGIAHDFNNLLGLIMGYLDLAKNALEPGSPALENLTVASRAVIDAKNLTRRFIAISRRAEPEKRLLSIEKNLREFMESVAVGSRIHFATVAQKDLWPVEADQGQLRRVFLNLLENAMEAMPEGGAIRVTAVNVTVDAEMYIPGLPITPGQYVKISIEDDGCGIMAEHLPLIFDPYYSTKAGDSRKGMGLGLTTAYSIVKNHQGYIQVHSKAGEGTRVDVYLPAWVGDREIGR